MKASVLLTVYNCWPIALQAIEAHLKYGGDLVQEIVVVDDCSTQDVPQALPANVRVIRNETNKGYVKSVNIGFNNIQSDLVILFDADAIPLNQYDEKVSAYFTTNPGVGAIGFHTVNQNGDPTGMIDHEATVWPVLFGQQIYVKFEKMISYKSIVIHSCALVVRKAAVDSVGGFDEQFDFLDADADFSMKLNRAGWKLTLLDGVKAFHEGKGSPQALSKRVLRYYVNRHKLLVKYNKWNWPVLFKSIVIMRMSFEYLLLKVFGPLKFSKEIVADKVSGRRAVIAYVKEHY